MESIEAAEEDAGSVEEEDEEGQAEEEAEEEDETDIGCIRGALEPVDCGFSCESKGGFRLVLRICAKLARNLECIGFML